MSGDDIVTTVTTLSPLEQLCERGRQCHHLNTCVSGDTNVRTLVGGFTVTGHDWLAMNSIDQVIMTRRDIGDDPSWLVMTSLSRRVVTSVMTAPQHRDTPSRRTRKICVETKKIMFSSRAISGVTE